MKVLKQTRNNKRGAALVEYGLIVAGVALVAAAAVSIFGTKTAGMIGASAAILPGAHQEDNGPIVAGKLIDTTVNADGSITVDTTTQDTTGANLGIDGVEDLVDDPND